MTPSYVDFHLHLLPGVDDGSASLQETLLMIECLIDLGFSTLVCTPHQKEGSINPQLSSIEQVFEAVLEEAGYRHLDVELILGAENFMDPQFLERLEQGTVPAIGKSDTFLLEFPPSVSEKMFKNALFNVQTAGYTPIVAHVERYHNLTDKSLTELDPDILIQVNLTSFLKENTPSDQRNRAIRYFEKGQVDLFATDMHAANMARRIEQAMTWVEQHFGDGVLVRYLQENPRRILENLGPSPGNGS